MVSLGYIGGRMNRRPELVYAGELGGRLGDSLGLWLWWYCMYSCQELALLK